MEKSGKAVPKRVYNQFVTQDGIEGFALRYTPEHFRKWSGLIVSNTVVVYFFSLLFIALNLPELSVQRIVFFIKYFWQYVGIFFLTPYHLLTRIKLAR